ncbi:MAG: prepilin-type N-terminal cleavage/methylation domain-containing protein [Anaerolineae bacterium]|nr:prepilin-type N-terminal cleavage/methylation domain-containing protein [Phycisphaerae bacterium]
MSGSTVRQFRRAFTLVEVLVVVGIISVLIAILLPTLARAREQSKSLVCQSNMRQWSQAALMYANENNGWLPRRGQGAQPTSQIDRPSDWFNALPPIMRTKMYVERVAEKRIPRPGDGSIWSCPSAIDGGQKCFFSYAMNMRLSTWQAALPDRINRIGPWATVVFLAEGAGEYCSVLPSANPYTAVARHGNNRRANLGFLDGHVASYTGAEIGVGKGEVQRADVRWVIKTSTWAGPGGG